MDIEIKKPCPADWDAMTGDEQSRFCGQCQRSVHNIAEMTAEEAATILCEPGRKACIRVTRAQDGSFRTKSGWVKRIALAGAAGLVLIPVAGCEQHDSALTGEVVNVQSQREPTSPSGQGDGHLDEEHQTLTGDTIAPPKDTSSEEPTMGKVANPEPTMETTVGVVAPVKEAKSPN